MNKPINYTLLSIVFLFPLVAFSQLYDAAWLYNQSLDVENQPHWGFYSVHVTNNNKYLIGDDDAGLYILEIDEEKKTAVDYSLIEWPQKDLYDDYEFDYDYPIDFAITNNDSLIIAAWVNTVFIYSFNNETGIWKKESTFNLPEGYSCQSITISNNNNLLCIVANSSILTYSLNAAQGQAHLLSTQDLNLPEKTSIENSSFNNQFLLLTDHGASIYVYNMDPQTYTFEKESVIESNADNRTFVSTVQILTTDSNGYLYVASTKDSAMTVYSYSEQEKAYKQIYENKSLPYIMDIAIHPNEELIFVLTNPYINLYAFGGVGYYYPYYDFNEFPFEESIFVFRKNGNEFNPIYEKKYTGDDLRYRYSIEVSSNGKYLYEALWSSGYFGRATIGGFSKDAHSLSGSVMGTQSKIALLKKEDDIYTKIQETRTNKQNEFEFDFLSEGDYIIQAIPSEDSPFLPTYYNQTSDINDAEIINLQGNVSSVDITLVEKETATAEFTNADLFTVYPNPVSSDERINIKTQTEGEIIIRNALGETVFNDFMYEGSKIIGNSFTPGIYFISFMDNGKEIGKEIAKQTITIK